MKKVITILLAIIAISTAVMAQVTDGFSYQAVVRNASGQLLSNRNVGVRISIIKGTPDGSEVYNQTFTPTTNNNGLFTIVIGGNAAFNSINWSTSPYFLHSEIDINGGTNYTLETVQQIHAVPFALHANVADSVSEHFVLTELDPRFRNWNYEFDSLRNVPDFVTSGDLSITRHGDTIFLNNGSYIILPNDLITSIDWDSVINHPTNLSQFVNDLGFLTHVGLISWDSIFDHPTNLSQFYNDLGFLTHVGLISWDSIFDHPTNLSQFYNDLGFLTHVGLVSWDSITGRPTNLSQFNNDLGFITTETQNLADVLSINNSAQGMRITNLGTPVNANDAANKIYVDNNINRVLDSLNALRDSIENDIAGDIYELGDSLINIINHGDSTLQYQINNLRDSIIDLNARINAVRDSLNDRIDGLDDKVDSLDSRIDSLEQRVFALEHPVVRGALTGVFSVGNNSKIVFSQGNLQYRPSTLTWRFAKNQYDKAGNDNTQIRSNCTYWIDLFGFGTSGWNSDAMAYQPYSTSTNDGEYMANNNGNDLNDDYADADWGYYNPILNGGNQMGVWRTLSQTEWDYMLNIRPNSTNLKSLATVNAVPGLILLPDTWTTPAGINFTPSDSYATNSYSAEQWTVLEAAGAVFLPAAGKRVGSSVSEVGTNGQYWTSSHVNSSNAYIVNVSESSVGINAYSASTGCAVRLVKSY